VDGYDQIRPETTDTMNANNRNKWIKRIHVAELNKNRTYNVYIRQRNKAFTLTLMAQLTFGCMWIMYVIM